MTVGGGGGSGGAASGGGGGGAASGGAGGAASGAGSKRSAPLPARPAKRAAAGAGAAEAASGSLGMGHLIGAMVREYLRPVYVYTVTSGQSEHCCGGDGDTLHGVYGSALLARGAAREAVFDLFRHSDGAVCNFESFQDPDEYSGWRKSRLRKACEARGLKCEGVKDDDLRTCLRDSDYKVRLESVRAAARKAGEDEDGAEDDLNQLMCDESSERYESAVARYRTGDLDAGKAFDNEWLFEERWGGEDTGGIIFAPEGGSCCWGSVAATITVARSEVRMHPKKAGEEEEKEKREEEDEEEE